MDSNDVIWRSEPADSSGASTNKPSSAKMNGSSGTPSSRFEISDYLHGRWLPLLIAAPVAVGLSAGILTYTGSNPGYKVTSTVSVAQAVGDVAGIAPYVNDFQSAVTATGVSVVVGNGSDTVVSLQGKNADTALRQVRSSVRTGLVAVAGEQRQQAKLAADAARNQEAIALSNVQKLENSVHVIDVQQEYRTRTTDILNLQNEIATAEGANQPVGALTRLLAQKEAALSSYAKIFVQDQQLQSQLDSTSTELKTAQDDLALAQDRANQVSDAPQMTNVKISALSGTTAAARAAVIAGLLVLAVLGAILIAAVAIRRRSAGAGVTGRPTPPGGATGVVGGTEAGRSRL